MKTNCDRSLFQFNLVSIMMRIAVPILILSVRVDYGVYAFTSNSYRLKSVSEHQLRNVRSGNEHNIQNNEHDKHDKQSIHRYRSYSTQSDTASNKDSTETTAMVDPYHSFPLFDKVLFMLFSNSVTAEMERKPESAPKDYGQLMGLINEMTKTRSIQRVNDQGKNMLKRLFPPWLLTQYKWMFAAPFPEFSAWMNAYVTHWTTNWLMGNSTIYDLEYTDTKGNTVVRQQQGLLVEKCRFLETAGCARTCLHACKIPTQRFFLEEMGLPVTLSPNMTDFSCKFEFGIMPLPLEDDPISKTPCLSACPLALMKDECMSSVK